MITFIFGDSITQGYWDENGGWADRIKAHAFSVDVQNDYRYHHGVYNLGVNGDTTQQILERFTSEVDARLIEGFENVFIFATGVNDTVHNANMDYISSPEAYARQLQDLTAKARQYSDKIAFINLLPVVEQLVNPLPASSSGKCFTNDRITDFNTVLMNFCTENTVNLIDIRSKYMDREYSELLTDGLHPNSAGHEIIYNEVLTIMGTWMLDGDNV